MYQAKKTNSVTFQRFHCLTLDVGVGGITGTISLDTCLANYFAMEASSFDCCNQSVIIFVLLKLFPLGGIGDISRSTKGR